MVGKSIISFVEKNLFLNGEWKLAEGFTEKAGIFSGKFGTDGENFGKNTYLWAVKATVTRSGSGIGSSHGIFMGPMLF